MQWSCEVRRVPLSDIYPSHGVNPNHRSRTPGPPDVEPAFLWGYNIRDGNHRRADAARQGKWSMVVNIWRRTGWW